MSHDVSMYIVNLCEPVEALKCLLALRLSRPGNVECQPVSNVFMCSPFDVLVRFCLSKFDSQSCWQIIHIQIFGHDLYIRGPGVPHANWSSIMHVQVLPTSLLQQSDFSLFFPHVGAWQEILCTATWKVAKLVSSGVKCQHNSYSKLPSWGAPHSANMAQNVPT